MANREACELYIEQEIEDGLKQGKKPYSIGKELATWIEKLFEVKINPSTIEKRAERQRNKNTTNVVKKSNNQINTEVYYRLVELQRERELSVLSPKDSVTHPPSKRGGKRKDTGCHQKQELPIIDLGCKTAFESFYNQVQKARSENWQYTNKRAISDCLIAIEALIEEG